MSKTNHYDAHRTLKPGEPGFTLQGGDPLASKAIIYYADLLRTSARKADTRKEAVAGLRRAAACEEVAWSFDAYRSGQTAVEAAPEDDEQVDLAAGAKEAADRRDALIRAAVALSNARSTANDAAEALERFDVYPKARRKIERAMALLQEAQQAVDPRES